MPIPEKIKRVEWDPGHDEFLERATVKMQWSLWPRKCAITNQWLCFSYAVKATRMWTGPGTPVFEHRWYNRYEFLMMRLKGNGND